MRIAFFGTPDFAIPSLKSLVESPAHEVVCVVTQPDKASGRKNEVVYGAVKRFALANNLPVLQPHKISNELHLLEKYAPDIIITCAFGQILKENVLNFCKHGVINVHASLLPKYRGSSPIQWAIINGEKRTGITIMQTDIGLDTGDIILQMMLDIKDGETAGELFVRLADVGAQALGRALEMIEAGTAKRVRQNNLEATVFPMLSKETARIRWSQTAIEINNLVRGLNPWPVAYFTYDNDSIRVFSAKPYTIKEAVSLPFIGNQLDARIGCVVHASPQNGLFVMCKDSVLRIDIIQIAGGRVVPIRDFLNGHRITNGTQL